MAVCEITNDPIAKDHLAGPTQLAGCVPANMAGQEAAAHEQFIPHLWLLVDVPVNGGCEDVGQV